MKKSTLMAASAAVLAIFAACSTLQGGERDARGIAAFADDPRLGEQVSKICFNSTIDGFGETTRDTVVLKKGVRDEYIVEVFGSCYNLNHAQRIALDSHSSCLTRYDDLIVYESPFGTDRGIGPQRCSINRIYKWDSRAEAEGEEAESDETGTISP